VIITPDIEVGAKLEDVCVQNSALQIQRVVDHYPAIEDLERTLRSQVPDLVFLSVESLPEALEIVRSIEQTVPGVQIVGVGRSAGAQVLLDLMRAGVREFQNYPFERGQFDEMIKRVRDAATNNPVRMQVSDAVFSFLPAKAGCGTSTIALNTSLTLSTQPDTKSLLMDLDLNSGLLGFMLKLDSPLSIYDAAEHSSHLDEQLWPQLVVKKGALDVVCSGRLDPRMHVEPAQIRALLTFVRRFYKTICLDLSGNMEKYSIEVMQESKRVFVVCTPEIPALHLARKKVQLLQNLDLGDRVSVLLNRAQKNQLIGAAQIEKLLGVPVYQQFPNDYAGVHQALTLGKGVEGTSELGRQFRKLALTILEREDEQSATTGKKKKGLLSMIGLAPASARS
jgi:pilus assembly protein CpaE